MKSFFSKIGTLLLCGVAVAMVGCNDLQEDINKAQNDISAVTVTVEDLQSALAALEAEQDRMAADYAKKADVEAAKTALEAKLATEKATLESAINAINTAVKNAATKQEFEALQTSLNKLAGDLQTKAQELTTALEGKANKADVEASFATLEAKYKSLTEALAGKADKADVELVANDLKSLADQYKVTAAAVQELTGKVSANTTDIDGLKTAATEAAGKIATLEASLTSLSTRVETLEGQYEDLNEDMTEAKAKLQSLAEDLQDQADAISALQEAQNLLSSELTTFKNDYLNKVKEIEGKINTLETTFGDNLAAAVKELNNAREELAKKFEAAVAEIQEMLANKVDKAIFDATIANLNDELYNTTVAVGKLLDRVQSLVYVPDFDDHKATIYYAEIIDTKNAGNTRNATYISRQSIIRYRVNAKAGESAAKAASDLAKAWGEKPSILSFDFQEVAARKSAPVASLEIAKVEAKGEDLFVYSVAKNFDAKFFESEKNIYSVALVLADGNNNISSTFTNLTAGKKDIITPRVIDAEGKNITDNTAAAELLPYDGQDPSEVVVLKGHRLGFVINNDETACLTIDEMLAAGYDLDMERRVKASLVNNEYNDHSAIDSKPGVIREVGSFNIEEREFVSNNVESDTYVTIKGTVTKEQYKALKEKEENVLTLDFNYIVNGVTVKTTGLVEMCNRLVTVDLGAVEIPWTLKLADDLYTDAGAYTATVPYVGFPYNVAASANKPLQGYSLYSILQTGTPVKTHGGNYDIQMSINDETVDFKLSGDYAFAPADAEKENWNTYTVQWKNDFDDLTITVKAAIKLGELPAPFVMDDKALDFKIVDGTNDKWVYSQSKIVEKMFTQYRALIGVEKDDDAKALFSKVLKRSTVDAKNTNVNGYDLLEWNITTPINSFDPLTIGLYEEQFAKEGAEKISVAQNDANTGVAFNFYFEGAVSLPNDVLAYSTVDFVSYDAEQQRYEVEVDGDIVNNKYTIDQADLGKYFYVTKDAEYLLNNNDLKVKFVIKTKDAPKPVDTDVVGVYNDAVSGINVLEDGQSVIKDWTNEGKFGGNEILVEATLYAHGFAVDTKEVTLFTVDPLNFTKIKDIEVERVPGQDAAVYTHSVLSLTETISGGIGGNLIKTDSYPSQIFADSKADVIYGAKFIPSEKYPTYNCRLVSVWTGDREAGTAEEYPSNKYIFNNGKITLKADDGLLKQPIFAEVEYVLTHDYNYGKNETVVVKVTFLPNNTL